MSYTFVSASHGPSNYSPGSTMVLCFLAFASGIIVLSVAIFCKRIFLSHYAGTGGMPANALRLRGRGLASSALAAIPTFAYQRSVRHGDSVAGGGWAQCAVCLGLVREGEVVRQLPGCKHLFHVECIDMWLHSHPTCPLCRADLREAAAPPRTKAEPGEASA